MEEQPPFFALADVVSLRHYYSGVMTVDDFTRKALGLTVTDKGAASRKLSNTALYKGMSSFFGRFDTDEHSAMVSVLVDSLVDSAVQTVEEYNELGESVLFPIEPPRWEKSRASCRAILANAFLCNIHGDPVSSRKPVNYVGGLDFHSMFASTSVTASEKVQCLIQYFVTTYEEMEKYPSSMDEMVVFHRICGMSMDEFQNLKTWTADSFNSGSGDVLHEITVYGMENESANAMVNFANSVFGVGQFLTCSMQEEIMQMCCPEFNVAMLVYGQMPDDTVVIARNVRRFSTYRGFGTSFRFQGPLPHPWKETILTMDASITYRRHQQFSKETNLRDIHKAYASFLGSAVSGDCLEIDSSILKDPKWTPGQPTILISTGRWGCGAFGGDPILKFLQQIIAAKLCGSIPAEKGNQPCVALLFSAYGDERLKTTLAKIYNACQGLNPQQILDNITTNPELFPLGHGGSDEYSVVLKALQHLPRKA